MIKEKVNAIRAKVRGDCEAKANPAEKVDRQQLEEVYLHSIPT